MIEKAEPRCACVRYVGRRKQLYCYFSEITHSQSRPLEFTASSSSSSITKPNFPHGRDINRMWFFHPGSLLISSHLIKEATRNLKCQNNSTTFVSFQHASNQSFQKTPFSCNEDSPCEVYIRSPGNFKSSFTTTNIELIARTIDTCILLRCLLSWKYLRWWECMVLDPGYLKPHSSNWFYIPTKNCEAAEI